MAEEQPLEDEVEVTDSVLPEGKAEKETPVVEEGDSTVFSDLTEEFEASDKVEDGLEEATPATDEVAQTEEVLADSEVPEGKETVVRADDVGEATEEVEAPTEEPAPEEEEAAATTEPEVQTTESDEKESPEPGKSYETLRTEALVELEEDFAISEEDAQTLVVEPEKVLPKLAADLYMRAYENITKSINAALPQMIAQTIAHNTALDQATASFYAKWAKLDANNSKHTETVNRIGVVYRQVNPKASQEQFIAEVGAQALLALGIPFAEIVDAPPVEKPFVPAAPAAAAPMKVPKVLGMWEEMADELIDDDS